MAKVWQARPSAALVILLFIVASAQAADPAWISYGPGYPIARTIVTNGGGCPEITVDGRTSPMRVHATPAKGYDVTVCEAELLPSTKKAVIGSTALPAHKLGRHERIALLGDTGCRRKSGGAPQDCNDPDKWPFAKIAASIAEWDPDAILHVGDYYYREAASCTATTCTGTKYDWSRWNADFFTPAAPLLAKAPWIYVRGNHEECSRAGEGWVRFLDPRNYVWESVQTCNSNLTFTPPYRVSLGGDVEVAVMDSSAAKESDTTQAAVYAGQLGILGAKNGAWLTLHHPFWAMDYQDQVTETLWSAWQQAGSATDPLSLVVAGHVHLLELLSFTDKRTPLVVVGDGGTSLDGAPTDGTGQTIGGRTVASFMSAEKFGYIAATRTAGGWTFDIRDTDGKTQTKCNVTAQAITCD
jgi:hypothetical protein